MEKWLGVAPEVRSQVPGYVIAIIAAVAGIAVLFVLMSLLLKYQVDRRTHALRSERDLVKGLVETSPVGIAFAAADGRVTLTNARAEELLGVSSVSGRSDAAASAWRSMDGSGEAFAALERPVATVLETRLPVYGVELEADRADGRRVLLSVNGAPVFTEDGELSGALTAFEDVTERERAREELETHREHLEDLVHQRTMALEVANEQLESFSYSVSHDLRAPLRALDGFSYALLEDAGDRLDEESKEYLVRIRRASQRMAELIDALLRLSRVGRVEIQVTDVSLSEIAERVAAELADEAPERSVEWRIEGGLTARADAALAAVVLENLLGNAWKFSAGRSPAHIAFGATQAGGERVFFVRDDGVGFDEAHAVKLFQPFERLHTADQFAGTGIGLATVRRAIARQGGRCWAQGEPEAGATFFFTL
jgi:PAS domain S-box-containing protein